MLAEKVKVSIVRLKALFDPITPNRSPPLNLFLRNNARLIKLIMNVSAAFLYQ